MEPVGGTCHGNGCRRETTRFHAISCIKTGWSSLTHNRVLHHAVARSLRESNVQIGTGQQAGHNPLRMDVTTEAGALFDNDPQHKDKALLLDLAIVNPCVSSNLEGAARQTGKHLADAVEWNKNKYCARSPLPTPSFSRYVDVW